MERRRPGRNLLKTYLPYYRHEGKVESPQDRENELGSKQWRLGSEAYPAASRRSVLAYYLPETCRFL